MVFSADDLVGQKLGGYFLDRRLGTGGAGIIYLAHEVEHPEHQVAIKVLTPPAQMNLQEQSLFRKRFILEATTLTKLHHPHILPVLELADDEATGLAYMVMPYISGGTLADRVDRGPLPLQEAAEYIHQLAVALDYAHQQGIIHRDLKPSNVLLDEHDQIYLADFGIIKLLDTNLTTLTNINQMLGTPGYMAPEQLTNLPVGPTTDVYGLGILAYQLVTGTLPFDSSSLAALLRQITIDEPASPHALRPDLPVPAADAILRAMDKDPKRRFPSPLAFAQALERGLQNKALTPTPQSIIAQLSATGEGSAQPDADPLLWTPETQSKQKRRVPLLIGAGLLAVLVAVASGALILARPPAKKQMTDIGQTLAATATSTPLNATATTIPRPTDTRIPAATPTRLPTPTPTMIPVPPTITWSVVNLDTGVTQQFTGNGSLTVHNGARYQVTLRAQTPSAPHSVSIGGGASWSCSSGDLESTSSEDFATQTVSQAPGQKQTELSITQTANLSFGCSSGFTFSGGHYGLTGTATNFANQQTSGGLGFSVIP
jgi:serine/threonine protein kinase